MFKAGVKNLAVGFGRLAKKKVSLLLPPCLKGHYSEVDEHP